MMSSWWRRHPLAWCALAALAGVLWADSHGGGGSRVWWGLALMLLGAAVAPPLRSAPRPLWIGLLVICLFGGLHSARLAETFHSPLVAWLEQPGAPKGRPVEVSGRELRYEVTPAGRVRCLIEADLITFTDASGRTWRNPVRIRALLPEGRPPLRSAHCRLRGLLRPPPRAVNQSEFDSRDYSLREGVLGEMTVTQIRSVDSDSWTAARLLREGAAFCRRTIEQRLGVGLEDRPDELSVIRGMVLGSSEDTDPLIEDAFRRSGTLHVFAVSGLHVALISVILQVLLRPLCLRRHALVLLVVPLVFGYAYLTGWRPSAARAALMVSVLLASGLFMRRSDLLNSLGGAALVLLAADTHLVFQAGFQLSFGVLMAIALFAGPLLERTKSWSQLDPFLPPALASFTQRLAAWSRQHLAALASVSAAAWIGSLPLMWFHFHTVTPAALIANCLLIPLAFACLGLACASLAASLLPFSGGIQIALNQLCAAAASLMIDSAGLFAALPGASFNVPPLTRERHQPPVEMRWFALPYGAEAGLLRLEDRDWMLDCGDDASFGRVLYPTLRQSGVNRLAGVFLSHSDAAHVGGLAPLEKSVPLGALFHPLHEPWRFDSSASKMRRALERDPRLHPKPPPLRNLQAGDVVALGSRLRPARLNVLHPGPRDAHGLADDRGLVALLELGGLRVLWTADAGYITEQALLDRGADLRCDVLVRGAHEGDSHGSWSFLEAAAPSVILSAGSDRDPALKLPDSVRRYAAASGATLLVLPECGEVTLRLPSESARHFTLTTHSERAPLQLPLRHPLNP